MRMAHSLAVHRRRLLALPVTALVQTAGSFLRPPDALPGRTRVFTPWVTFWVFLAQVLSRARTCREAVYQAQGWFRVQQARELSSNTSAYCQARLRLPQPHVDSALKGVVRHLVAKEKVFGSGRRVRVVDGSSCSMPDTPANQARYPQPRRQKPGCGFPVMRFVALFSLATGALLAVAQGPLSEHERTLWRRLWDALKRGDIALADRGFCSFADYWLLFQRGVDCVMRLHARRSKGVRKIKRLAKDDWLVEWVKTKIRPKWMEHTLWAALPETLRVRHVTIHVAIPGFRTKSLTIATTLLDANVYPAEALAGLYRRRWRIELFLRDIKITMGMDVLRCKTPALIQKEFTMHLIAYNLVRALMIEAATRHDKDLTRLSLAGAISAIRQWAPSFVGILSRAKRRVHLDAFLRALANDLVPYRPNRIEPRARKRRPKNYQLLNKPRRLFKEIQHRNRYEKGLS
jgi:hypothetical protein